MHNKILLIILLIGVVLVSGCAKKDCPTLCKDIPFSETAPEITQQELSEGWYYGSLNQKKPGTPDDWIHKAEGTRSASWTHEVVSRSGATYPKVVCDCDKY